MKQTGLLKKLYALPICKDRYGGHHLVVFLTDPNGTRYVWSTTNNSDAVSQMDYTNFFDVSYNEVKKMTCGDIQIERVKVMRCDN